MYKVYVLYSQKHDKVYIGFTSNLFNRLIHHYEKGIKGWSIRFSPWVLVHLEEYSTKSEAMKREKSLKGGQGRNFIRKEILQIFI